MAVVVLILLAVAGAFAHWLGRGPGARALALFRRESKPLLAPVALVFGQIVVEAIPPGLAAPFFTGSVSTLTVGLSLPFMLWVALEVTVRSWLVREVVRLRGGLVAAPFARHAGALFALSAAMWFAVLGVLVFAGLVAHELGVVAVLVWGGFVGWLSARAAPVLAVLAKDPALGARAIGPGRELYQRAPWPWRWTVLVELVVLGAVTYVHYSGDEALAFNGAVVTELTTSNGWPKAVAAATRSSVPIAVFYGARLFTAFASTLFVAAYVILGEESKDAG